MVDWILTPWLNSIPSLAPLSGGQAGRKPLITCFIFMLASPILSHLISLVYVQVWSKGLIGNKLFYLGKCKDWHSPSQEPWTKTSQTLYYTLTGLPKGRMERGGGLSFHIVIGFLNNDAFSSSSLVHSSLVLVPISSWKQFQGSVSVF